MAPAIPQASASTALEHVVTHYATMVRTVARGRGLSEGELDEVIQDVRIRLWRSLDTSERISKVNTSYVYQAAMSAVCDLLRRRRSNQSDEIEHADRDGRALRTEPGPDTIVERMQLAEAIETSLMELGPERRPLVRMYLAGYAQAEIQHTMGWTEAKTRNHLYRGLQQLRGSLSRRGIHP